MEEATALIRDWCAARPIEGLTVDVHRLPGLTPLIVCEVPASDPALAERTVLLYGHLDKQPEMAGWREGLGPWTPVIEDDKLYGRGGADDGYAAFAALVADRVRPGRGHRPRPLRAADRGQRGERQPRPPGLRRGAGRPARDARARHLPRRRLPRRRAAVAGDVAARPRQRRAHRRGARRPAPTPDQASGVVPSSFRIIRELLDRVEDSATGEVLLPELHVEIPPDRIAAAADTAAAIAFKPADEFPFAGATQPMIERRRRASSSPRRWHADAQLHRRRRVPAARPGRQRAAAVDPPHAQLPPAADVRRARRRRRRSSARSPPTRRQAPWSRGAWTRTGPGWAAPPLAPWLASRARRRVDDGVRPAGHARSARAARSRSWGCSAPASRTPSSSSPAPSSPAATPTVPTSSSTCPRPGGSPSASPACSAPTPRRRRPDRSAPSPAVAATRPRDADTAVVAVAAQPCRRPTRDLGIGVVVADGLVLTAAHTVDGDRRAVTVDGRPADGRRPRPPHRPGPAVGRRRRGPVGRAAAAARRRGRVATLSGRPRSATSSAPVG